MLDAPTMRDLGAADGGIALQAQRMELHGRMAAGSAADDPVIETVLRLNAAAARTNSIR